MEIERKFLVREPPGGWERSPSERIRQGYLAAEGQVEVRLRERGGKRTLTVKTGHGRSRVEEELALEDRAFDELWPATEGRRVEKVRHAIPHGALTIELDVYEGELSGLTTAEVEFDSEHTADAFEPPGWLGREITGDATWSNRRLAERGLPEGDR